MPTNQPSNEEIEEISEVDNFIYKNVFMENWAEAKQAITTLLVKARIDGLKEYSQWCGILRLEPSTIGLKRFIKAKETQLPPKQTSGEDV